MGDTESGLPDAFDRGEGLGATTTPPWLANADVKLAMTLPRLRVVAGRSPRVAAAVEELVTATRVEEGELNALKADPREEPTVDHAEADAEVDRATRTGRVRGRLVSEKVVVEEKVDGRGCTPVNRTIGPVPAPFSRAATADIL